MSKRIGTCAAIVLALSCLTATAAELKDMIGRWRWQEFTIEVSACPSDSICAKVVAGPQNVGMALFASKLVAKDGNLFGQVTHPETKEVYNTRFQQKDQDKWLLDGCTAARVCLSGEFLRVK
ncbi:MAG: hypothetical protein ACLPKB_23930 [Xanthobacteraceae bacterium]